jgi:hypothetical protein
MISGLAHVMAMNPIFRSFFSSGPRSCAMACSAPMGRTDAMAARAVFAPTAFRKRRRTLSTGNSAFTRLASTNSADSCSGLAAAGPCSPGAWSAPHAQRSIKGRSAS